MSLDENQQVVLRTLTMRANHPAPWRPSFAYVGPMKGRLYSAALVLKDKGLVEQDNLSPRHFRATDEGLRCAVRVGLARTSL